MIALSALIVLFIWAWLGFILWRRLIHPYIQRPKLKVFLTLLLTVAWFVGPVLDEILGARHFEQLCREMPPIKFYGPVAVGAGVFFDEQGRPKWKNRDEFWKLERTTGGIDNVISSKSDRYLLSEWPMPIVERRSKYFEIKSGTPVVESFARYSPGGWLRRFIGIGDYQCPSKGKFPRNEEFIVFK